MQAILEHYYAHLLTPYVPTLYDSKNVPEAASIPNFFSSYIMTKTLNPKLIHLLGRP